MIYRYNHLSLFYAHSAPIFKLHQLLQFSFSLTKCMYLQNSTTNPWSIVYCRYKYLALLDYTLL